MPGPPAVLTLDGRLTGDEIAELRRAVNEVGGHVSLDLTDLQFADRQGVSVLRELRAQGAQLILAVLEQFVVDENGDFGLQGQS